MTEGNGNSGLDPAAKAVADAVEEQPGGGRWRLATIIVSVVFVAAIAGLGFALVNAQQGKTDAESALAVSQGQLSDLEGDLGSALAEANRFKNQRDSANTRADEKTQSLDKLEQAVVDLMAASFVSAAGVDEGDAACMAESVIGQVGPLAFMDAMVGFLANPFSGAFLEEEAITAADACGIDLEGGDPEPALEVGQNYGDNPTLDALWDQCGGGDGAACDTLYNISEVGSDYERFGGTCGDRYDTVFDAPLFCEGDN